MAQDNPQNQDDTTPIWGASAIARQAGLPDRAAAYNLLSQGLLPGRRLGRKWVSTVGQIKRAIGAGGDE